MSESIVIARRNVATTIALFVSFITLCLFYGMTVNAVVFAVSVFLILISLALVGTRRLLASIVSQPLVSAVPVFFLIVLILNYQTTISKDTSFAPIWALALVPIVFFVARELGIWRWRLHGAIAIVLLGFAVVSIVRYILSGEEAAAPLTDANNYAALLYLVLIPWSYRYLMKRWSGSMSPTAQLTGLLGIGLLVMGISATQSRAGILVVTASLVVFVTLVLFRRLAWRPVVELIAVTVVAYAGMQSISPFENEFTAANLQSGVGVRALLNSAALSIAGDYPLLGSGVYTFPLLYRLIRDPLEQTTAGLSVHNDYLQFLAEGGPLMVLPLIILFAATSWRVLRAIDFRNRSSEAAAPPDFSFGVLLALGAVLSHAYITFVLFTPALAFLVGLSAAMVNWSTHTNEVQARIKKYAWMVRAFVAFGWISFAYLLLDTLTIGVFGGQSGIPMANYVREDPERMLTYARTAEAINGSRGVPILAQAILNHQRLREVPDSDYLIDITLDSYRRAKRVDPWNPRVYLAMYSFVVTYPDLRSQLEEDELPENLLVQSVVLDPVFVEGYDTIIRHFDQTNSASEAYSILVAQLVPWMQWLAELNSAAARRYVDFLGEQAALLDDRSMLERLPELEEIANRPEPKQRVIWWYSAG